jgi:hypothetical protein
MDAGIIKRGDVFAAAEARMMQAVKSGQDTLIELVEGVDDLCQACPLNQNGRCESPHGNEEATRKWDTRILQGLGITYGYAASSAEYQKLGVCPSNASVEIK